MSALEQIFNRINIIILSHFIINSENAVKKIGNEGFQRVRGLLHEDKDGYLGQVLLRGSRWDLRGCC